MKFTKLERKEIYLKCAKSLSEKEYGGFICNEIQTVTGLCNNIHSTVEIFPELALVIIDEFGKSWNSYNEQSTIEDTQERIIALLLSAAMCGETKTEPNA